MEAKKRGAKVIHVDPRFTRTSALADLHVPIRAGADIAFVGGIINYVLTTGKFFRDYVINYTNAATILTEDFADTEDLDGVFSGLDREYRLYDMETWRYQGEKVRPAVGERSPEETRARHARAAAAARAAARDTAPAVPPATPLRHRRDAPEPVLRVPGSQAPLRPLHAGDGRRGHRDTRSDLPEGLRADNGELRARPHHRVRLQRGLDPPHDRRPEHPKRVDPAGTARQHRPAGRRRHGAARPRLHPGLHRHPDPVRPAARVPADAARVRQRGSEHLRRRRDSAERVLGEHQRLHGEPAQGLLGRRGHQGQRLLLRVPAPAHRQPQHLRHRAGPA